MLENQLHPVPGDGLTFGLPQAQTEPETLRPAVGVCGGLTYLEVD